MISQATTGTGALHPLAAWAPHHRHTQLPGSVRVGAGAEGRFGNPWDARVVRHLHAASTELVDQLRHRSIETSQTEATAVVRVDDADAAWRRRA